jgi:hypothetical protein
MRQYAYSALIAALLYPLTWWWLRGKDSAVALFGDGYVATYLTVGIICNTALSLLVMRAVATKVPQKFKDLVVRFCAAELAGLLCFANIYGLMLYWKGGVLPSFSLSFFLLMQMPSVVATYIAYFIVRMLIKPEATGTTKTSRRS